MTLSELRTAVRQRADIEGSSRITDAELASYINQSVCELYDLLVAAYGDDYYLSVSPPFQSDGADDVYPLPPDFYKLLGAEISTSGTDGTWRTLYPFNISERNRNQYAAGAAGVPAVSDPLYRLRADGIWFQPQPLPGLFFRTLYIPRATPLTADDDAFDGISGWDEYVIVDAAIKCMRKDQIDTSELAGDKLALKKRIETMRTHRNAGQPKTTQRTRRNQWGYDMPGLPGGRGPWGW